MKLLTNKQNRIKLLTNKQNKIELNTSGNPSKWNNTLFLEA